MGERGREGRKEKDGRGWVRREEGKGREALQHCTNIIA